LVFLFQALRGRFGARVLPDLLPRRRAPHSPQNPL